MKESLKKLISSDELLKARFSSEHWKEYLSGLDKLFEYTNIDGFEWYRAGDNLCFSSHFGVNSIVMYIKLQQKCPVLIFSSNGNKENQEEIKWPFFESNGIEFFCTKWQQFWTESRINNYHNQTYQNLIQLLMTPAENIYSVAPNERAASNTNYETQSDLANTAVESKVIELVQCIKKMVEDPELELAGYNIGITLNSTRRQGQYQGVGMRYFEVLCDMLSSREAIVIEEVVHNSLTQDQHSITYHKYRSNARGRYRANLGGRRHTNEKIYDFYIAWWKEGEQGFTR